jgi:ectoine hydroxylase-related dioxygenase (phytanoyl-CoA dioxygenase family)
MNARDTLTGEGYVVIPDLLAPGEVKDIHEAVNDLLEETPTGRIDFEGYHTQRVYNLLGKTRATDFLVEHPQVLDLCDAVLGKFVHLSIALAIHILPGEKAQVLHRDDGLFPVPKPHPPLVVNTMWAITDFTDANGATRVVPGSHTVEELPKGTKTIGAEMSKGSVLCWLGSLWHGGGANSTGEPRLGIAINYTPSWLRQQENQYLAIPRDDVVGMSETLQRLVGYGYHPPFIGFVDGRDPIKLLRGEANADD